VSTRAVSGVVAVTNAPHSPLAGAAQTVLALHAGSERGGVACRTFQATLAVLYRVCGVADEQLRGAVEGCAQLLASRTGWLDETVAAR
jgi:glutamine---fructose-6-phosphate transaminase (isomerizing)